MVSYRLERNYTINPRNGALVHIVRVSGYYLGTRVLAMTNCDDKIWIRNGLDSYVEEKVLRHEEAHIADPSASEFEIRRRSNTLYV